MPLKLGGREIRREFHGLASGRRCICRPGSWLWQLKVFPGRPWCGVDGCMAPLRRDKEEEGRRMKLMISRCTRGFQQLLFFTSLSSSLRCCKMYITRECAFATPLHTRNTVVALSQLISLSLSLSFNLTFSFSLITVSSPLLPSLSSRSVFSPILIRNLKECP